MSELIRQQISRLMHSDGPQRDINGVFGDIAITSEEDMAMVLDKLESNSLCVDKISVLSLVETCLVDSHVVGLVKIIRSVPRLHLDQVQFVEKHWQAIASGLNDCGARVEQIELSNFPTKDDSIVHIIRSCLSVANVTLTRMVLTPEHWTTLAEYLDKDDHKVKHLSLFNIHIDDQNVQKYSQVLSKIESVHLSGLGNCGHYTTYTEYPDMNMDLWSSIKDSLKEDSSKVSTLKLSLVDNVALRRNIDNISEIVTNVNNVILNDFCLETDQWKSLAKAFSIKDKKLKRLELFQLLGISEENIPEIGICLKWTQEVRITSSGSLGELWPQLGEILSSEKEKQLELFEICSLRMKDNDTVGHFVKCINAVKTVKLEKIRLTEEGWTHFVSEVDKDVNEEMKLQMLHLTECWPPDSVLDTLKNMKCFGFEHDTDTDLFSLNSNNIILKRLKET